jgi:hypothetical protein
MHGNISTILGDCAGLDKGKKSFYSYGIIAQFWYVGERTRLEKMHFIYLQLTGVAIVLLWGQGGLMAFLPLHRFKSSNPQHEMQ